MILTKKQSLQAKKRKNSRKIEDIEDDEDNILEVPNQEYYSSDYDSDDKAEIRALAKKMLRKKNFNNLVNYSYNRYVFPDGENIPKWFKEEEKYHNIPQKPVTKEEVLAEKKYLMEINARAPKKVMEAKARKKMKFARKMEKVKKKAEIIVAQEELTELSKLKQIERLYKREFSKMKEEKKYVVSKSFKQTSKRVRKHGKNVKLVDRRMKSDKRGLRAAEKRNKKGFTGKKKRRKRRR